jgi:hypothetical protein
VSLYVHSLIHLRGAVLNKLSTWTTLAFNGSTCPLVKAPGGTGSNIAHRKAPLKGGGGKN